MRSCQTKPPPIYEEVVTEAAPKQPSPLVVRLRIWYHTQEGRSPDANNYLADMFRGYGPQDWEVIPSEVAGVTGQRSHDQFVPVEVQFCHKVWNVDDPGEHAMADVRKLFFMIAPQFVYRFFIRIGAVPHSLSISPMGAPDHRVPDFTHTCFLNPLGIPGHSFASPRRVNAQDAQLWLEDAVDSTNAMDILAAVVSLYLMYEYASHHVDGRAGLWKLIKSDHPLRVSVPDQFPVLQAAFDQFRLKDGNELPLATRITDVRVALRGVVQPLQQHSELTRRLGKTLQALENQQALSDQDLFNLAQDLRQEALLLSRLKETALPLVRLLEERYDPQASEFQADRVRAGIGGGLAAAAIAAVAIFCWWNPVGWAAAAGAYSVGTVAGAGAGGVGGFHFFSVYDRAGRKAFKNRDQVHDIRLAIKALDDSANQARYDIATVFCSQIMKVRLDDTLPGHTKRTLLSSFGVDMDALHDDGYAEEMVSDRLKRFRENNDELRKVANVVLREAGCDYAAE